VARQILSGRKIPSHYASADEPVLKDRVWIEQQWEAARFKLKSGVTQEKGIFVLDEVQKISGWSETVKRLWDEDSADVLPLQVIILGSSQLLMQEGLTESLAGRLRVGCGPLPVFWGISRINGHDRRPGKMAEVYY